MDSIKLFLFSAITFDSTQLCLNRIQYHSGIVSGIIHTKVASIFSQSLFILYISFIKSNSLGVNCNNLALFSRQFADNRITFFSLKKCSRYNRFSFQFHLKFANSFIKS